MIRKKALSAVGIETGEKSIVSILLAQSVFLGIFFGAFDISAHSLFLSIFDEKMMAIAYIASGLVGILLTVAYIVFQTKMKFKISTTLNLTVVTILSLLLWLTLVIVKTNWAVFLVFTFLCPLNILAVLGFWETAGSLLKKRYFRLIDSGLVVGIIIICFTIPALLTFNLRLHNILFISVFSIIIVAVIQIFIAGKENIAIEKRNKEKSVFNDKFTKTLGTFIVLSVITACFVQYSFLAITRLQYPTEVGMAKFLGIFTGSVMIFTLLVKLFVFPYFIRHYGLKTCLIAAPILMAVFTAGAIIIGTTMGYTPEAQTGFFVFFILLALGRFFSKLLKDSIELSSLKVIYQTIDEKTESALNSFVNPIALLLSGLILAGMGILSFIKIIHFSWALLIFLIIWGFVAIMLYSEYKKSIRQTLENKNPLSNTAEKEDNKQLMEDFPEKQEHITTDSKSGNENIIATHGTVNEIKMPKTANILRLLRDNSIETKRLGILLIGKFKIKEMISEVCACLNIKKLELDAYSVLDAFGNDAEKELEEFFLASSGNLDTSKIVLRLIGNQKTTESKSFLFSRLWSNSRQLKEIAAKHLADSDFKPTPEEKDKLHQIISETIGIIIWNLAAQLSIEEHANKPSCDAIISETDRQTDYLFDLLSVTYGKSPIEKIRENLENETIETVNHVLEMIDIVIDEVIKQKLVMLVDAVSPEVKLKKLYRFYPVSIQDFKNTVEDLINRDYNLLGIWTKACALRCVKELEEKTIIQSAAALMFSPEEILREEAVRVITKTDTVLYESVSMRLPESSKIKLDKIANGEILEEEMLFEKTSFLRKNFNSIPEDKLLTLAAHLKYYKDFATLCSENPENVIIWHCSNDNTKKMIVHYEGKLNEKKNNNKINSNNQSFYALPITAVYDFNFHYPECSMEILKLTSYIKNLNG